MPRVAPHGGHSENLDMKCYHSVQHMCLLVICSFLSSPLPLTAHTHLSVRTTVISISRRGSEKEIHLPRVAQLLNRWNQTLTSQAV